ncbi:MAG: Bro-N domain-containing protein [Pseudomonadota bacterium]
MLNALESYQFEENPIRVVVISGDPWFVAVDVAKVLGYAQAAFMTRNLDEDEKGLHIVQTLGGDQQMNVISESGLYAAIFKSRREEAQRFRRWVTGEVLPAIRRTGRYELFEGDPAPAAQLPSPAIDDAELGKINAAIGIMREARQIWGREDCREIWIKIGLPAPMADAVAQAGDPIAEQVAELLKGHDQITIRELCRMTGMVHDMRTSLKLGSVLRLLGWSSAQEKIAPGVTARVWRRIPRVIHGMSGEA